MEEEKPIIVSKFDKQFVGTFIWGPIFVLFIACFLLFLALLGNRPHLGLTIASLSTALLAILIPIRLLFLRKIFVYETYIVFKWFWGLKTETVLKSQLNYWIDGRAELGYAFFDYFLLIGDNKCWEIRNRHYAEYGDLKKILTKKIRIHPKKKEVRTNRFPEVLRLIVAVGFTLFIWVLFFLLGLNNYKAVNASELTIVSGEIGKKPTITRTKGSSYIKFYLKNHPNLYFEIAGASYEAINARRFTNNVDESDIVNVSVSLKQYFDKKKKIESTDTSGFWDVDATQTLKVYELNSGGVTYLSAEDYNLTAKTYGVKKLLFAALLSLIFAYILDRKMKAWDTLD